MTKPPGQLLLGHHQRGDHEVVAAQPKARDADQHAERGRGRRADHAEPRIEAELDAEQRRHVGADAEEEAVPDRGLPGIAAEDVPAVRTGA